MSKISAAHSPIMTPLYFLMLYAEQYTLHFKNEVEPIACPLGKLNPEISIKRSNVGRSRSKYFLVRI